MHRFAYLLLLLTFTSNILGQSDLGLLTVQGKASVFEKPDIVVLNITINEQNENYSKSIDKAKSRVERLKSELKKNGIETSHFKTKSFNVYNQPNYGYNQAFGTENSELYMTSVMLEIEHEYDKDFIEGMFEVLNDNSIQSNFNMFFKFSKSKEKDLKAQLVLEAVKNAKTTAMRLSEGAGQNLGSIYEIEYGNQNITYTYNYGPNSIYSNSLVASPVSASCNFDFCASDIQLSEYVTIRWQILSE